jgi:hypothetical protein
MYWESFLGLNGLVVNRTDHGGNKQVDEWSENKHTEDTATKIDNLRLALGSESREWGKDIESTKHFLHIVLGLNNQ